MARGEARQIEYLLRARDHLNDAIAAHQAGMRDPALADVETAAAFLEDYREGPLLAQED